MMDKIDFRSDTVTWPTPAMREAMATATVGDDVYGEDPTINQLEAIAAEMTGKEAGLFVSSGTMGNLVSILAHATRGDQAIVGDINHTFWAEAGGMAALGGIMPRPLPVDEIGRMDIAQLESAISPDNPHYPITRLICLENTCGGRAGAAIPLDYFTEVRQVVERHGLTVHLDGARLFNAVVKLGVPTATLLEPVDSVSICLSKGLCAPVGSIVTGSADFIYRARRARKLVGGGIRQGGILAAAAIISLTDMVDRLADDHARAARLAQRLAALPGIVLDLDNVHTNMVFFSLADNIPLTAKQVAHQLAQTANVWVGATGARSFRAVTHYWIDDTAVDTLVDTLQYILAADTPLDEELKAVGAY